MVDKKKINVYLEEELIPFLTIGSLTKEEIMFIVSAIMVALD